MSSSKEVYQPQPHEKDARWTAVDVYAREHILSSDSPYYEALNYALDLSIQHNLPKIEVSPLQGRFLALQCQLVRATHVLEVGTLGGYSSIWLASASPDVHVTSVEVDPEHKAVAEKAIAHAGLESRIDVLLGPGNDVLPRIRKEIDGGTRPKFQFVFIDADKENNMNYLNGAIPMCESRACVIVDNVVRRGGVADAERAKADSRMYGSRAVIEAAAKDKRVECTVLQTVGEKNYDGFLMCVVK